MLDELFSVQVNAMNTKMRTLKRDKEETEGELETCKSRMRQLRSQLEDAEETASSLQTQMTKLRSASRKKVRTIPISIQILYLKAA